MNKLNVMRSWACEAVMECQDIVLLDFVWTVLTMEGGAGDATP